MEDNEHINKHLKESMDEFLVQPKLTSFDDIIKKVEKKRRRKFFIFFFPGALFLAFGTIALFNINSFIPSKDSGITLNNPSTRTGALKSKSEVEKTTTAPHRTAPSSSATEPTQIPKEINSKVSSPSTILTQPKKKTFSPKKENSLLSETTSLTEPFSPADENTITSSKEEILNEPAEQILLEDKKELVQADKLDPIPLYLPLVSMRSDLIPTDAVSDALVIAEQDSLKKKNKVKFLIGLAFNPQFGSYLFQKNSNTPDKTFSEDYLTNKKEQNSFKYNYAWGIKTGILIKDKWEILVGFGFQRYNQEEKIKPLTPTGPVPTVANFNKSEALTLNSSVVAKSGQTYVSKYSYSDFSLEGSRIIDFRSLLKVKMGVGLHMQHLSFRTNARMIIADSPTQFYYGNGYNSSINSWQSVISIKGGLIEDLSKRIQVQLCPNFFYMPNSMFKKDYVIKQKAFGFGIEALLLFKIG